jgi:hypothetical protein
MLGEIDRAFFARRLRDVRETAKLRNEEAARPYKALIVEYERKLRELH